MSEHGTDGPKQKILVTSALPYANGHLHLGHIAGAYLPADAFVRYHRLKGNDVVYIGGSDEHGSTITLMADAQGITPQELVDKYHVSLKDSFEKFGISFDNYSRTSLPIHHETSKDFFLKVHEKGALVQRQVKQFYCETCAFFLADRYINGTCPHCHKPGAKGDQCEKCGKPIDPIELKDAECVRCGGVPEVRDTAHWYFSLDKYQGRLQEWLATKPNWKPNVLNFCKGFFGSKAGLEERCITRDLPWGVSVPLPDHEGKVLYVWFDAPIGYISSTKEWAEKQGDPDRWKDYWCNPEVRLVHFIGKDNIFFHAILFPAMLMEHGDFVLPENVPANEFLNLEGDKFSTSRGYAVWLPDYLEKFPPDPLRYSLSRIAPETKDSDFSWKEFQAHHNNELADILGNFVNRTLTFAKRYFDNKLPPQGTLDENDGVFLETLRAAPDEIGELFDRYHLRDAAVKLMDVARAGNLYFDQQQPWKTRKDDLEKCGTTIRNCVLACRSLATLMCPILPFSSEAVWRMLNLPGQAQDRPWDEARALSLPEGHPLGEPEILFKKIEDDVIDAEIARLRAAASDPETEGPQELEEPLLSETISFDDFKKIDLRVAEVIEAEKVANTDKLLKLSVRVGSETRPLVAGVAQHYEPGDLVGKKIVIVANLAPAKIRGVESQGMLLAAVAGDSLALVVPDREIDSGTPVH